MKTIVLANHKGGCAKTTTALNIAVGLAAQGSRVLAVDLDPQGNLSAVFGVDLEDLEESRRISMRSHSCRQLAWLLLLITSLRPFGPRRVGRGWAR